MKRAGIMAGAILGLGLLCIIAPTFYNFTQGIRTVVGDLDLGQGQRITIFSHVFWEVNRTLYFQVRDGFRIVNDGCSVTWDLPGDRHNYAVVYAENRSVIGVLDEPALPLFIMCDLA